MYIDKIKAIINADKHLKDILYNSSVSMLFKVIGLVIGYASVLYITNKYGADKYGLLVILLTIVSIFSIIPIFGMSNAMLRVVGELWVHSKYNNIRYIFKKVLLCTTFLAILFVLLLYFSSGLIAHNILNKAYMQPYIKILSITIIVNTVAAVMLATIRGMKKIKSFVFVQTILNQLVFFIFLLASHFLALTIDLIHIYLASVLVSAVLYVSFTLTTINKMPSAYVHTEVYKYNLGNVLTIAWPMLLTSSFGFFMVWTDIIMLGIYATDTDIGIYNVARKMANVINLALFAMSAIMASKFIEFYSNNDMQSFEKIAKQSTKLMFFVTLPLLLIYLIFPSFIMGLFGEEFVAGTTVLVLIAIAQFINVISGLVACIMQMTGNHNIVKNVFIIIVFINAALNYILIPVYGINGAALATAICIISSNIIMIICIKKKLGFWTFYIPYVKL